MDILEYTWRTYPVLVDFAIYFFVMVAASRAALAKTFPGHNGKVLAVAVGLFLAAGLAMAQRTMGFSVERMGPIAAVVLCGIVLIVAYRFLQQAQVPRMLAVLLSVLLALALVRTVMPQATERFLRENPLVVLLALGALIVWAWNRSGAFLRRVENSRPGAQLAKHRVVPDEKTLKTERRWFKKRFVWPTKETAKETTENQQALTQSVTKLDKGQLSGEERAELLRMLDGVVKRARDIRERCVKLSRLDRAIRQNDWQWLRAQHGVSFDDFTPEQRRVVEKTIQDERKRLRVESAILELLKHVEEFVARVEEETAKARDALSRGNSAAASGWVAKAQESNRYAGELERRIRAGEHELVDLVRRQRKEIMEV